MHLCFVVFNNIEYIKTVHKEKILVLKDSP